LKIWRKMRKYKAMHKMLWGFLVGFSLCCGNALAASGAKIERLKSGGFSLKVDGKPFLVKGVSYNPAPIGAGYDYDLFSDPAKPWLVDGPLMRDAGINCIRVYSAGKNVEDVRAFVRQMYEKFGIYTIFTDWLGLWDPSGPNYADQKWRNALKQNMLKIVRALRDEPGILMWCLGNENNYSFSAKTVYWSSPDIDKMSSEQAKQWERAKIYYSFVNDLAKSIKKIDKRHLVGMGNGETGYLDIAAKYCADVDVLALIMYRGPNFGILFDNSRRSFDKPIILSEFGCDSFDAYNKIEAPDQQSVIVMNQWKDIYRNTVFGSGNIKGKIPVCLGGVLFEWTDEWWKHNESFQPDWIVHNTEAGWAEGAYYFDSRAEAGLNINEEWFGIVAIEPDQTNGVNIRVPRKAYYAIKEYFASLNNAS